MDLRIINRGLATLQPLTADAARPDGLPPALEHEMDAVVRSSMRDLPVAIEPAERAPPPQAPFPLVNLPTHRVVMELKGPAAAPLVVLTQVAGRGADPLQPAPTRPQDAASGQPTTQQRMTAPLHDVAPSPQPSPQRSPQPSPTTQQQLMAEEGRRMVEEFSEQAGGGKLPALKKIMKRQKLVQRPEVIAYRRMQAESFKHNYLPSDGGEKPRDITRNDAIRELYKYSDYLPKKTSLETLKRIVDGTVSVKDRPAQLIAAAQYMVDHPDVWTKLTGKAGDERIKRAGLGDALSRNIQFSKSQLDAVATLEKNPGDFFDGRLFDREKLHKMIANPGSKPENVAAAKELLQDPVLFGMLDNTEYGHKSSGWRKSDDGLVGRNDLRQFLERVNRTPAPDPAERAGPPGAFVDPDAVQAMRKGQENQPAIKTQKGGGLKKGLLFGMKVFSTFEKISSEVWGVIAALKIPLLSQVAAAASVGTRAIAGGVDVGRTAIDGGNVKSAAAKASQGVAETVISVATVPGAGKAATGIGKEAVKEVAKAAAKATATETFKEVVGEPARDEGQRPLDDHRPT
jgi:type III secretion translocon protein HrpF